MRRPEDTPSVGGTHRRGESKNTFRTISPDPSDRDWTGASAMTNGRIGRRTPVGMLIVLTMLVAGLPSCKPKTNAYAPPPPADVTVAHPIRKPVTRYLEYTGTTEPFEAVELRARVAG